MARITATARGQYDELFFSYLDREVPRPEAAALLARAFDEAVAEIDQRPGQGTLTPSSYRGNAEIARRGYRWIKKHCYFFAYIVGGDGVPVITGVHYETSDIPGRVADDIKPIDEA